MNKPLPVVIGHFLSEEPSIQILPKDGVLLIGQQAIDFAYDLWEENERDRETDTKPTHIVEGAD